VGVGKTIEACLIARELIDRGEVERLAVLCPPHLAEQWQAELLSKFHINAELVLPSTATRLERNCRLGQSVFDVYPHVIVSMDFIKSDRRRDEFLRTCPELVIVDEVHTCADPSAQGRKARHQRHQLVSGLAAKQERHMILVTATPHSGKEDAFRSLLALLNPDFVYLPEDVTGPENEYHRRRVASYFIQRSRGDILHYLDTDTPFPKRDPREATYTLSENYRKLFDRVLRYARETITDVSDQSKHHQRVRWWSMLALLRSLASSPAAAAETLRNRAATLDTETPEEADELGRRAVLDVMDDTSNEGIDVPQGSDIGEIASDEQAHRRRLVDMARQAEALKEKDDRKLQKAADMVKSLVEEGHLPILFCRFIPTAEYVAQALRGKLPDDVEVSAVTGLLPPAEREDRVNQLAQAKRHVLVCTDCLSEGINLQEHFDAVLHYDLSWNPTRHEQREGRVDRFGQPRKEVTSITYYGTDNQIDGIVLDVLLRKHREVRKNWGISVPVPPDSEQLIDAIFEGLLLREQASTRGVDQYLPGFEELLRPQKEEYSRRVDASADRERRSRTMFAQERISVDEVARELEEARSAIGAGVNMERFVQEAFRAHGGFAAEKKDALMLDPTEAPRALREAIGMDDKFAARFDAARQTPGVLNLNRTHPIVEGLATYVMDTALDPISQSIARRCGVIRTRQIERRTTVLLMRLRYHIIGSLQPTPLLVEDCQLLAFEGATQNARWLDSERAEVLLQVVPDENISHDLAANALNRIMHGFDAIRPHLDEVAIAQGDAVLDAHRRVREASRTKGVRYSIKPILPPDILGIYVYLPKVS
jgi:superfamily II DNA or RNA helicase